MLHLTCFPASSPLRVSMATYQTFWEACMRSVGLPWQPAGELCSNWRCLSSSRHQKKTKQNWKLIKVQFSFLISKQQSVLLLWIYRYNDCILQLTILLILWARKSCFHIVHVPKIPLWPRASLLFSYAAIPVFPPAVLLLYVPVHSWGIHATCT